MPEFLNLLDPQDALHIFLKNIQKSLKEETVFTKDALGRVTSEGFFAPHPLPEFPRSTVDGFAVRAADTFGANESLPAYLIQIGEVPMGDKPIFSVSKGECALIHTGGMIPKGSDAVIMVENTQTSREDEIELLKSVAVGENIINIGEDIQEGEMMIPRGRLIRPAEIGGLMAFGVTEISVVCRPVVGILSSGDEVIPPDQEPNLGQVRDINGYSLKALVEQAGGNPNYYGILPDSKETMMKAVDSAKEECDVIVITAGSSASTRDLTAVVLDQLGEPGVLVHGVNVRPGKPTILAVCDGKAMIGLPGNPVSALVISGLFVAPAIKKLLGIEIDEIQSEIDAKLSINISSQAGREDWVPVRLDRTQDGWEAVPIFGRSNLIFNLVKANGLIRIPTSATGLSAGEHVKVRLF